MSNQVNSLNKGLTVKDLVTTGIFTAPSTWTWVGHLVSGLHQRTRSPCSDSLSLRLRPFRLNLAR